MRRVLRAPIFWGLAPETANLIRRFSNPPTDARKAAINKLIVSLKSVGVWALLDAFYLTAAADEQAAQRNWVQDAFNLSPQASPTFTADRGYAGNGTTSFLATGITPASLPAAGGRLSLNSAHLSIWCRNNVQSSTQLPIGSRTTSTTQQFLIVPRLGTDVATFRVNQDVAGAAPASLDSTGHWTARRDGAATDALFKNGALVSSDTAASTGLSTAAVTLGALNTGGTVGNFATHQIASASIGAGLTDAQEAARHAAVLGYLQSVGAA